MVTSFVEKGQGPLNEIALTLGVLGAERILPLVQQPLWPERIGMAGDKPPRCATALNISRSIELTVLRSNDPIPQVDLGDPKSSRPISSQ